MLVGQMDDPGYFQVVDPHVRRAGATVDVEKNLIDVRFALVDLRAKLSTKGIFPSNLPPSQ